jgi:predicted HTH transcriptional regulator
MLKRGGRRPGAGRKRGGKNAKTIEREMEEAILRQVIKKRLEPIVEAQLANAQGIKYLVVRERKGGKFVRVHEAMARNAKNGKLGKDGEIIEVWEKDPSVHAFKELLDRAYGRAKEPEQKVEHSGRIELRWRDRE